MIMNDKAGKGITLGLAGAVLIIFLGGFVQLEVQEVVVPPNETAELPREYLAIPKEQLLMVEQLTNRSMVLPVNREIDFWEEKAKKLYHAGFELRDDLTQKEVGHFFNIIVSDYQLYDGDAWGSFNAYVISGTDIRAVLYSHLPIDAIQQEEEPFFFDPMLAFNEDGEKYYPYHQYSKLYTFTGADIGNAHGIKVMETIHTEKVPLEDGCDLITIELVSYDMDKYYAAPQEKVVLETYRFSVKVADDSWFIEEATITKAE
jgi:hypothetical protein